MSDEPAWDYVDFEEVEWVGPGLVSGGYLVFRTTEGVEVDRQWYPCPPDGDEIAIITATLRHIFGAAYHGRDY